MVGKSGTNGSSKAKKSGYIEEAPVPIKVSSHIIEQYARHLYTNPRKAIEELACNSYDAGAKRCFIRTPQHKNDPLVVLDNGTSMDHDGLEKMWEVGKSPKAVDEVHRMGPGGRHVIGKFGVGKLAAFALGSRLTHFVHKGGITRKLSVDLEKIRQNEHHDKHAIGSEFPVFIVENNILEDELGEILHDLPRPWDEKWDTWTIAVVDEINVPGAIKTLEHGIVRVMIGSSLPLHADFEVTLNGETVKRKKLTDYTSIDEFSITNEKVQSKIESSLKSGWAKKLEIENKDVPEKYYKTKVVRMKDPHNENKEIDGLEIPKIGPISGSIQTFKETLTSDKVGERGYANHGYFVRVHDKLLNPGDNQFGFDRPNSYASWNRCHISVEAPELDQNILVNRNEVEELDDRAETLRLALQGCFNLARSVIEPVLETQKDWAPHALFTRLGQHSTEASDRILQGLSSDLIEWTPDDLSVEVTENEFAEIAIFNQATGNLEINVKHPLAVALGLSKESAKNKAMREILVGNELVAAYLRGHAVSEDIINGARKLWDALAKAAAGQVENVLQNHVDAIEETHPKGDKPYEIAICNAFDALGLATKQIGGSGAPDGKLKIIVPGDKNVFISIEAKGGKSAVDHKRVDVATIGDHLEKNNCNAGIVVAKSELIRKGKSEDEESWTQLVENCRKSEPPILIFPHERIIQLLELHASHPFAREQLRSILTTWRHPDKLEDLIQAEWDGRDVSSAHTLSSVEDLFEVIDSLCDKKRDKPGYQAINATPPVSDWGLLDDELWEVIVALHRFCQGGLVVHPKEKRCELRHEPKKVLELYQANQAKNRKGPT